MWETVELRHGGQPYAISIGYFTEDGAPAEITRRYERMYQEGSANTTGAADRRHPPHDYHLRRVELRNAAGALSGQFDAGDVIEIHLFSNGPAPENSFTAEFKLFNSDDEIISFGWIVGDTYEACRGNDGLPLYESRVSGQN